jgi:8-oxo-dGTP pyrophosphatase MutT (NUDIX family)
VNIRKVCPVVLRQRGGTEVLAFVHPLAGRQLVKGSIEQGETIEAAGLRELREEAGIAAARAGGSLGSSSAISEGHTWYFLRVNAPDLPDAWVHHCADDGGLDFAFFWHRLGDEPASAWHPPFQRALAFVRDAVA